MNTNCKEHMNTFFVLMFERIYGKDIKKLFDYLKRPFPFSDMVSFTQTMVSCKNNDTSLESFLGMQMISSYGAWIYKQKTNYVLKRTPPHIKYDYLKTHFNNLFISQAKKDDLLELFFSVQRHYMVLSRFAYMCKWKRAPFAIDTDLYLNTIEKNKTHTFTLYQNKTKFLFNVPQLIRVMENDLFHDWEGCFCVHVKCPKNPYNKLQFHKVDLYNLYFHFKNNMNVNPPQFLYLWFLDDFCVSSFTRNNDRFIRKQCIRHYAKTVSNKSRNAYEDVLDMIDDYDCKWSIDPDFPRDILIDVMRPYLYVYYLVAYDALSDKQSSHYESVLTKSLMQFYKKHRTFGRKIFVSTKKNLFPSSEFYCNFFKKEAEEAEEEEDQKEPYKIQFNTEGLPFASWSM